MPAGRTFDGGMAMSSEQGGLMVRVEAPLARFFVGIAYGVAAA